MSKHFCVTNAILILLIFSTCSSKQASSQQPVGDTTQTSKHPGEFNLLYQGFNLQFEGKIGEKYMICLELKNVSGKLTGNLTYQGQTNSLKVTGVINRDNNLSFDEYNANGKHTGTFKGQLKDETMITGQWSKPDGSNQMPFEVYVSEGNETFCTGVNSGLSGEWTGVYTTKEGKTLEVTGPSTKGEVKFTIDPNYSSSNYKKLSGIAYLVSSSLAEYTDDANGCSLKLFFNGAGEIEVTRLDGGSTTLCDVYTGSFIFKK